jgi:hypothetical protein
MNHDINKLIEKYWEAETTIEEEEVLKTYFNSDHVAKEHLDFAPLFSYYKAQLQLKYDMPLDLQTTEIQDSKVVQISTWKKYMYAVASIFVLGLGSIYFFKNISESDVENNLVREIEDPEEALALTLKALAMVSKNLKTGTDHVESGMQNVNKANIFK